MSELTKEQFDEAVKSLATRDDLQRIRDEILFRIADALATIEEGLEPEERLALIEQKLNRVEQILHLEL
jgi:hypothetical protein